MPAISWTAEDGDDFQKIAVDMNYNDGMHATHQDYQGKYAARYSLVSMPIVDPWRRGRLIL